MKKYGIRLKWKVTASTGDRSGLLIEQLRYAGIIERDENIDGSLTLIIWCPLGKGTDHQVWQQKQVERMVSFGLTAEPTTRG